MHKDDFIEYYKTLTTSSLLEILGNKKEYQESAIEAAQAELDSRNISEDELKEAKLQLLEKTLRKETQQQKIKDAESRLKNAVNKLSDSVNPVQQEKPTSEKIIKTIAIVYGGLTLFQLIRNFKTNLYIIRDIPHYPASSIISLTPLILIPVASILFFRKMKFGWILLTGLITCLTIEMLWSLISLVKYEPGPSGGLSALFPRPSIASFIIPLAILSSTLYLLCKNDIKEVFKISKNHIQRTFCISTLITVLLLFEA